MAQVVYAPEADDDLIEIAAFIARKQMTLPVSPYLRIPQRCKNIGERGTLVP